MKPILSRFCEIYVSEPIINGEAINLYKYNVNETFKLKLLKVQKNILLSKELSKIKKNTKLDDLMKISTKLYEKGYSALDVLNLLENPCMFTDIMDDKKRYELIICFNNVRREFRNEKLLFLFILNFIFLSSELSLENISFM
jgi:hypothetical protein